MTFDYGANWRSWWLLPNLALFKLGPTYTITLGWLAFYVEVGW